MLSKPFISSSDRLFEVFGTPNVNTDKPTAPPEQVVASGTVVDGR
jgi:hypothetical protein